MNKLQRINDLRHEIERIQSEFAARQAAQRELLSDELTTSAKRQLAEQLAVVDLDVINNGTEVAPCV